MQSMGMEQVLDAVQAAGGIGRGLGLMHVLRPLVQAGRDTPANLDLLFGAASQDESFRRHHQDLRRMALSAGSPAGSMMAHAAMLAHGYRGGDSAGDRPRPASDAELEALAQQQRARQSLLDDPFCARLLAGANADQLRRCQNCSAVVDKGGSQEKSFQRCSRCKAVYYCGPECQRAHWPTHKPVCRRV